MRAWEDACQWKGRSRVWIPSGVYMVNSVRFVGPCNGEIAFEIRGGLKAPVKPSLFLTDTWIGFQYVNDLTVEGGGFLDGQGYYAWKFNDCHQNTNCKPLPAVSSPLLIFPPFFLFFFFYFSHFKRILFNEIQNFKYFLFIYIKIPFKSFFLFIFFLLLPPFYILTVVFDKNSLH